MLALLSAGAQPHATDASFLDMKTPLHKAAGQGHRDVCIALLEAGADPNASDAAGNSPLDLLNDMSVPVPSDSLPGMPLEKIGDDGRNSDGVGGNTGRGKSDKSDAACTRVVVLSGGEEGRDWDGVREALERYGGRRLRFDPLTLGSVNSGGHGGSGDSGTASSVRCSGASDGVVGDTTALENVGASQPAISHYSSSMEAGGAGLSVGRPTDPTSPRQSTCKQGDPNADDVIAAGGEHATPQPAGNLETVAGENGGGVLVEGVPAASAFPAGGEGGANAGIPCGECRLPKVVMVRAACCGALLCKPCVRHLSARRRGCRRCSGDGGAWCA